MKIKTGILTIFLFVSLTLSAQEQEKEKRFGYSNITEFGLATGSLQGFTIEATSVHGILLDKKHHFGIGIGFGFNELSSYSSSVAYIPLFLNYRLYFKPDKNFSPCINAALGGLIADYDGGGFYSAFTAGFKAGNFSFSSGLSFMVIKKDEGEWYYDPNDYSNGYFESDYKWFYPFGISLKIGFIF